MGRQEEREIQYEQKGTRQKRTGRHSRGQEGMAEDKRGWQRTRGDGRGQDGVVEDRMGRQRTVGHG